MENQIEKSIVNYLKAGIEITQLDDDKIKIKQVSLINGFILNNKQLYDRAKELFPNKHIIPVVFSLNINNIDMCWIRSKMEEFGIHKKDIIKQLAIEKSKLNLLFSEKTKLTNRTKTAFYYYFLTYELNRNLRNI